MRQSVPLSVALLAAALAVASLAGCASSASQSASPASPASNAVVPAAASGTASARQQSPWRSLFDGKSLKGWRGYKSPDVPAGWTVVDGALTKAKPVADIMTDEQFGDFEYELEWKIGVAGNSGIMYRVTEDYDRPYWTGPEYQLLDDIKAGDNKTRLTCAGAAYGLYPSPEGHLKPVGEWNKTRILMKGNHVEHWLNDFKLLEYELLSPDWEAKVKASKFSAWPGYGRNKKGHITMQGDHNGTLAFRNIRVRTL